MRRSLVVVSAFIVTFFFGALAARASTTETPLVLGATLYRTTGSGTRTYTNLNFDGRVLVLQVGATNSLSSDPYGIQLSSEIVCLSGRCLADPAAVEFGRAGFPTASPTAHDVATESGSEGSAAQSGWYSRSATLLASGGTVGPLTMLLFGSGLVLLGGVLRRTLRFAELRRNAKGLVDTAAVVPCQKA